MFSVFPGYMKMMRMTEKEVLRKSELSDVN